MDSLITAAARALGRSDPIVALSHVASRVDPPALALRGIAMAQLGDLSQAGALLRRAAGHFGPREAVARARCRVALAEIALACHDPGPALEALAAARLVLEQHGDTANAAHAAYVQARWLLLTGQLDAARAVLDGIEVTALPRASRAGAWLVIAGIAMCRMEAGVARDAIDQAALAASRAGIPALIAEVDQAARAFDAPVARLIMRGAERPITLSAMEALFATDALIVDATRGIIRAGGRGASPIRLVGRPVLFALAQALAEAWPGDVSRSVLLARAAHARHGDGSRCTRLRVEISRLRAAIGEGARIEPTPRGFVLRPGGRRSVALLLPPGEAVAHGDLLVLLGDGAAWTSTALARALGISQRSTQRALDALAGAGRIDPFGRGRARRWAIRRVPGFPGSRVFSPALPGA